MQSWPTNASGCCASPALSKDCYRPASLDVLCHRKKTACFLLKERTKESLLIGLRRHLYARSSMCKVFFASSKKEGLAFLPQAASCCEVHDSFWLGHGDLGMLVQQAADAVARGRCRAGLVESKDRVVPGAQPTALAIERSDRYVVPGGMVLSVSRMVPAIASPPILRGVAGLGSSGRSSSRARQGGGAIRPPCWRRHLRRRG